MRKDDAYWAARDAVARRALGEIGVSDDRIAEIEDYASADSEFFHEFVLHILNHYEPPFEPDEVPL